MSLDPLTEGESFCIPFQVNIRGAAPAKRRLSPANPCILTLKEIQYIDNVLNVSEADADAMAFENTSETVLSDDEWYCELAEEDAEITGSTFVKVTGIDETFFDDNDIMSGEATLIASGAMIDGDQMLIPDGADVEIGEVPQYTNSTGARRRLSSTGDKTWT